MRIFWHFQCLVKTERRLRARSGYEIFWIQLRLEQPHHDGGLPQPEHVRQGQRRPADFQHRRPAAHESQTAVELVVAASERWQSAGRNERQSATAGLRLIGVLMRRANPSAILAAIETADRDFAAMVSGKAAYRLRLLSHYPQQ